MDKQQVSPEDFQQLLKWLGPDQQRAAEKYESIRRALTELFDNWNCTEADNLADETINRVLIKVRTLVATYSGDPALYFFGIAKNVRHEHLRRPRPVPLKSEIRLVAAQEATEKELLHACLDKCLDSLPTPDKQLILDYYRADKKSKIASRKHLGEQVGVSSNALRVRVFRLRETLEECISECLKRAERGNGSA